MPEAFSAQRPPDVDYRPDLDFGRGENPPAERTFPEAGGPTAELPAQPTVLAPPVLTRVPPVVGSDPDIEIEAVRVHPTGWSSHAPAGASDVYSVSVIRIAGAWFIRRGTSYWLRSAQSWSQTAPYGVDGHLLPEYGFARQADALAEARRVADRSTDASGSTFAELIGAPAN